MEKRNWKHSVTLKQRMVLCLAAFFAAFALQLALNGYQARAVQQVQDDQMGNFNAISRFQGGVESSISILEAYRWENGETEEMLEKLQAACSTSNAWLWRIRSNMDGLQNVSDEQWVLYGAVETTYGSYNTLLEELEGYLSSGQEAKASQLYYNKVSVCGGYLSQYTMQLLKASILDAQTTYTEISELGERIALMQIVVVALCVALGCASGLMVMQLLTPVSQMIEASRAISRSQFDTPDIPLPKQPEIAQLAESFNIIDQEKMKPTYRLIDGSVGNSYAIEISKHLGLNQQIIDHAAFLKSESMTTSQKLLEKLQTEMEALRQQKEELDKLQIEVQNKEKHYQQLLDNYQSRKEKMIEKAQDEANDLLKQAQDKVDVILKELQGQMKPHQVIQAKKQLDDLKYQKKTQENHEDHDYKIGDIVKVLSVNRQGEIIDINKKGLLTISMGGLKLNAKKTEVQFMHEKVPEKKETSNIRSLRKATKQSFELNIIGMRYEEAMIAVDKFIDNALVSNYSMVRIIHGMGTGVLRKGVRKLLDKNKYVKSYQDGGPNEGGLGATLVYFE